MSALLQDAENAVNMRRDEAYSGTTESKTRTRDIEMTEVKVFAETWEKSNISYLKRRLGFVKIVHSHWVSKKKPDHHTLEVFSVALIEWVGGRHDLRGPLTLRVCDSFV